MGFPKLQDTHTRVRISDDVHLRLKKVRAHRALHSQSQAVQYLLTLHLDPDYDRQTITPLEPPSYIHSGKIVKLPNEVHARLVEIRDSQPHVKSVNVVIRDLLDQYYPPRYNDTPRPEEFANPIPRVIPAGPAPDLSWMDESPARAPVPLPPPDPLVLGADHAPEEPPPEEDEPDNVFDF